MTSKEILRLEAKKLRQKLVLDNSISISSKKIVSKILSSEIFKKAKNIGLYCPLEGEIDIFAITKVKGKNFYLPRCVGDNLEFVKYENNNLKTGCYSIKEPLGAAINPQILDIIYVPALIANSSCYRLGWGKGYYDRFFNSCEKNCKISATKAIVISNKFIRNDFIEDKYDCKCELLITDV